MSKILGFAKKYPIVTFVGGMLFAGTALGLKAMNTAKDLKTKVIGA